MDVSIIIVNYNTGKLVLDCITSIYKFTRGINFEIIVVDNNSTDNSLYFLENIEFKIKLIKSSYNLGFGRANNLAYTYSTGRNILFLNPDTVLLNNAI